MKYLVNSIQMRECDRNTSEYYKVPSVVLMERAALAVVECVNELFAQSGHDASDMAWATKSNTRKRILVLCGTGNNGADGLAVARLLHQQRMDVHIFLAKKESRRSELNELQLEICQKYGIYFTDDILNVEYDMVVDALFGIGLNRELDEESYKVTESVNSLDCPVVSVDIPSGVDADRGRILGSAIRADITVTFGFEKIGMYRYPGKQYCGKIKLVPIGITQESFLGALPDTVLVEEKDITSWWCKRPEDGNKGTFGKVLIMAGQKNMAGACILAARSCYRTGAGMVQILTCEENREILQQSVPEALLTVLNEEAEADIQRAVAWADVIVAGPGIGTEVRTTENLKKLILAAEKKPLVLDADALNLLSSDAVLQNMIKNRTPGTTVLTPHPGELARLTGKSVSQLKQAFPEDAFLYAKEMQCILVAKDAISVVITPQGMKYLCDSGNDGMATAGTGDVLAGMIGALCAVNEVACRTMNFAARMAERTNASCTETDLARMVVSAVHMHGMAGSLAAQKLTNEGVMAGDLIEYLPEVISQIRQ